MFDIWTTRYDGMIIWWSMHVEYGFKCSQTGGCMAMQYFGQINSEGVEEFILSLILLLLWSLFYVPHIVTLNKFVLTANVWKLSFSIFIHLPTQIKNKAKRKKKKCRYWIVSLRGLGKRTTIKIANSALSNEFN